MHTDTDGWTRVIVNTQLLLNNNEALAIRPLLVERISQLKRLLHGVRKRLDAIR
jgi:hypothetical protein